MDNVFTKDLRIFGRDLSQIAIVDNKVLSFRLQLNNGIPIIDFFDDPNDQELIHMIYYMEKLFAAVDVRPLNEQFFQLESYIS